VKLNSLMSRGEKGGERKNPIILVVFLGPGEGQLGKKRRRGRSNIRSLCGKKREKKRGSFAYRTQIVKAKRQRRRRGVAACCHWDKKGEGEKKGFFSPPPRGNGRKVRKS